MPSTTPRARWHASTTSASPPIAPPQQLCRHFARSGGCLYGDACKFKHDKTLLVAAAAKTTSPVRSEEEEQHRIAADAAFHETENRVNSLRRSGAPREEILAAVADLEALKAARRALPQTKPVSRFQTRRRIQNQERAGVFRRWLLDTYGIDQLRSGSGVLDVAGGQGSLAFEFINCDGVKSTIVDPRPIERGFARLERKWRVLGGGEGNDNGDAEEDALTASAISGEDGGRRRLDPSTHEARTVAARLVHLDWKRARSRIGTACKRPDHWRLCWEPELYDNIDLLNAPTDASLQSLSGRIGLLLESATSMEWTRKGLVQRTLGFKSLMLRARLAAQGDDDDDSSSSSSDEQDGGVPAAAAALAAAPATTTAAASSASLTASVAWNTLAECSLLAGMHADGATEGIVDFALQHNKPFAVVPCCVYSKESQERSGSLRVDNATGLKMATMSYTQFIKYLVAKAPKGRIKTAVLPFEGKNIVVYSVPEGPCGDCEEVT